MTNDEKIEHVQQRIAARREQSKSIRARFWTATDDERAALRAEAHEHENIAEGMEIALAILSVGGDDSLVDWYREIRGYMAELELTADAERRQITLVGLSNCFGARCSRFAVTGITPVQAMERLRDQIREAVAQHRATKRAADTEPSPWVPTPIGEVP